MASYCFTTHEIGWFAKLVKLFFQQIPACAMCCDVCHLLKPLVWIASLFRKIDSTRFITDNAINSQPCHTDSGRLHNSPVIVRLFVIFYTSEVIFHTGDIHARCEPWPCVVHVFLCSLDSPRLDDAMPGLDRVTMPARRWPNCADSGPMPSLLVRWYINCDFRSVRHRASLTLAICRSWYCETVTIFNNLPHFSASQQQRQAWRNCNQRLRLVPVSYHSILCHQCTCRPFYNMKMSTYLSFMFLLEGFHYFYAGTRSVFLGQCFFTLGCVLLTIIFCHVTVNNINLLLHT